MSERNPLFQFPQSIYPDNFRLAPTLGIGFNFRIIRRGFQFHVRTYGNPVNTIGCFYFKKRSSGIGFQRKREYFLILRDIISQYGIKGLHISLQWIHMLVFIPLGHFWECMVYHYKSGQEPNEEQDTEDCPQYPVNRI